MLFVDSDMLVFLQDKDRGPGLGAGPGPGLMRDRRASPPSPRMGSGPPHFMGNPNHPHGPPMHPADRYAIEKRFVFCFLFFFEKFIYLVFLLMISMYNHSLSRAFCLAYTRV